MEPFELAVKVAASQDGVIFSAQAVSAGLTRDQIRQLCRSGRWKRLSRAVYLVAPGAPDPAVRLAHIRAAVTSLGPSAVAVLDTAAGLHGIGGLRRSARIHVSLPADKARAGRPVTDPGLTVHQLTLPRDCLGEVGGIAVTTALRTLTDLMLRVDRYAAVCVLDSALARQLIDIQQLGAVPAMICGRRGAVAARTFLGLVDGRVPPDDLQHVIRDDDGYLLVVADMVWRRRRVVAEADGGRRRAPCHAASALRGRRRQNRLTDAGWRVLRFTRADTMRPDYIPYVVREALTSRRS